MTENDAVPKLCHFKVRSLSDNEKEEMQKTGAWKLDCPVPLARLMAVEFSYWHLEKDKEGNWVFKGAHQHDGQITVLDATAEHVKSIFQQLWELKFPVHKARPMQYYSGDDDKSLADNNTSCFNFRVITGGEDTSLHGYGLAIDLNPIQNPYFSFLKDTEIAGSSNAKVLPPAGRYYINRSNLRLGMVECCDRGSVIKVFKDHGFPIWGGMWNDPIDWQHFQTSRPIAQLLAIMNPEDAKILFDAYAKDSDLFAEADSKNNGFVVLYKNDPENFMKLLESNRNLLKVEAI